MPDPKSKDLALAGHSLDLLSDINFFDQKLQSIIASLSSKSWKYLSGAERSFISSADPWRQNKPGSLIAGFLRDGIRMLESSLNVETCTQLPKTSVYTSIYRILGAVLTTRSRIWC